MINEKSSVCLRVIMSPKNRLNKKTPHRFKMLNKHVLCQPSIKKLHFFVV